MGRRYFILNEAKRPIPTDLMTWAEWFENHDAERVVARTTVGRAEVSTVFLGLDHNWTLNGPPHIYETVVFGGAHDQEQGRWSTPEEAQAGHDAMVEKVRSGAPE